MACKLNLLNLIDFGNYANSNKPIFNGSSNLAKNCIPIDQTTKWLPLNLTFRQTTMDKMRSYLSLKDFDESFRHPNVIYEDALRAKKIESDFETMGFYWDHFVRILITIILIKSLLQVLGN